MRSEAIVFERLADDACTPERATRHSAGYDIRAHLTHGPVRVYRTALGTVEEVTVEKAPGAVDDTPAAVDAGRPALELGPGDRALVPTGFRACLPEGYEGQIRIRSSVAWKKGLVVPNAPGTIDADYPDEWFVLVLNASDRVQRIEHGERIAQLVLNRYEMLPWVEGRVGVSSDRVGGIGSTSE